jgi:hypothetical protein
VTALEDKIRAAVRAKASEIEPGAPPLRLAVRRRRSLFLAHGGGEKKRTPIHQAGPAWLAPAASALLVAAVIAASAVIFTGRSASFSPARPPAAHAVLPPRPSSYLGVYAAGSPPAYGPVSSFAQAAGRQPNLVATFGGWGQPFPVSYAQTIRKHGAVLVVQLDPTIASVAGIAAGHYDGYLHSYADSVRDFDTPVVIGFGHEMNGSWYPWGYHHVPPSTFVAAWRHIVTLFRGQGADNVTWLWTIYPAGPNTGPVASWWPGASYVTWVGIDGYYLRPADTFATIFGQTIHQLKAFTRKPVLISETAVGTAAGQFAKIPDLFRGIRKVKALGLVWFDQAQRHPRQDWRLEDNVSAAAVFRLEASTLKLARP